MPGYSHQVRVFPEIGIACGQLSNSRQPPYLVVYALAFARCTNSSTASGSECPSRQYATLPVLHPVRRVLFLPNAGPTFNFVRPTYFRCPPPPHAQPAGPLYGVYYRAHAAGGPLPTVLYVYGGPGVQLVGDDWKTAGGRARIHELVALGYQVVTVDSRGSSNRRRGFTRALRSGLGTVEVEDQVHALRYLSGRGLLTIGEVVVYGSSYGGFLSLVCLAKQAEVFVGAAAFAPVTRWDAYDTAYTERYLGLPLSAAQQDNYSRSGVLPWVDGFPEV
jgi:dipeptidyl aminopeptidase/acylaminoacyl peptidase